ncbi:MAG: hypothetical protein ACI9ZT_001284 [Gammaproteobacteria bacterium]|jgi:hypothetical protein
MYKKLITTSLVSVGLLFGAQMNTVVAEEMPAGTVLTAANLDQFIDMQFEGKRVGDMLTERLEWMVREKALTMNIRNSEFIEMDEKYMQATQDGKANVVFNESDRTVSGWTAGMFFDPHDIDMDDPYAGDKLIWNLRSPTYGATMDLRHISWVFLDAKKGMERIQRWWAQRYYMEGRLDGGPVSEGDGTQMQKTVLVATYPQDIKGVGIYSIRYNDPTAKTPDDTWAYLKSVRRARRLTGNAWMDPIGGTVQLYDDWDIWDAVPTKYKSTKLLGRRWVFAIAHAPLITVDLTYKNTIKEFPAVEMDKAPHFFPAPQVQWEPREVFVIEGTPPDEHPYSKKVVYMEVDYPRPYLGEAYDQNGKFWKSFIFQNRQDIGDDGYKAIMPVVGHIIDWKAEFSTTWSSNMKANPAGVEADDVTLKKLIEIAR